MANVIKHKRGSGSDPTASDLVVGEVAIRTDVGKLFTKMDNGSVAEIAGGGSDIAINTLSSSSGTGGGSATFNGSAFRFTLSSPPSVSAQQLLVSINGVIQKPVAGTGQPSEGFSVDGTDIILGDAPATGSDFFILTFKSLGVSEPADNTVTSAKIVDGTIVNADINASAAIAVSKLSGVMPLTGGTFSGNVSFGDNNITNVGIIALDTIKGDADDNTNINFAGSDTINIKPAGTTRLAINTSGINVTGNINATSGSIVISHDNAIHFNTTNGNDFDAILRENSGNALLINSRNDAILNIDSNNDSTDAHFAVAHGAATSSSTELFRVQENGNVGIGTTSPASLLHLADATEPAIRIQDTNNVNSDFKIYSPNGSNHLRINHINTSSDFVTLTSAGNVGIGTSSPASLVHLMGGDLFLTANSTATDSGQAIYFQSTTNGWGTASAHAALFGKRVDGSNGYLRFDTRGSGTTREVMRIDSSGYVGIGTSNPLNLIHTSAANDASGIRMTNTFDSPDNVWALLPSISGVSNTGFTIRDVTDGRNCLVIDGIGRVSIGTNSASERLRVETTANTMVPMTINDSSNTSTFTHRLMFRTGNTEVGRIRSSSNATTYDTSISDVTLKKNFEDWTENTLNLFKNINPQKYNFIQEDDGTTKSKGFIAQEMVDSFPEAYSKEDKEDSKYYFNPSGMVVYLMKALQEAVARIEALEAK